MKKVITSSFIMLLLIAAMPIFNITTEALDLNEPVNPYPSNSSTAVIVNVDIEWEIYTEDKSDLSFDVFFGTNIPPSKQIGNQTETSYDPGNLLSNTTYYWQIVVWVDEKSSVKGPIWEFTTAKNQAPYKPRVSSGPQAAGSGIKLNFSAIATDPECNEVYIMWDWGDGNFSDWIGPYSCCDRVIANYSWVEEGIYDIRVKAKDENGIESDWSNVHLVNISKQIEIGKLRHGYLYFNFFGFDKAYVYLPLLENADMSMIISNEGATINATVSGAVETVRFITTGALLTSNQYVTIDDDKTDGFYCYELLSPGFYTTTVYAYDADGNLIDEHTREYFLFIQIHKRSNSIGGNLLGGKLRL